ncbi:uncharacterized protein A4U43_C07F33270 [Asparagus officinalis]|uniref:Protein kinase domain-containing protein n=1 Tax=Asparagus officinalis TaxID=4686 RepID=A0A5P1EGN6_ASPOF|nr:uncharacterized protein A4U43_C07F33270 [Asparagus officinalis]
MRNENLNRSIEAHTDCLRLRLLGFALRSPAKNRINERLWQLYTVQDGGTIALDWLLASDVAGASYDTGRVISKDDSTPLVIVIPGLTSDSASPVKGEANISYICSWYYRATELVFGATEYSTSIDIWSACCVLAELLLGQVLGTPTREEIRCMKTNYTDLAIQRLF